MQGFITESVSKITDGLGTTLQMLVAAAACSLLFVPIQQSTNSVLILGYLILLYSAGIFFVYSSLKPLIPDTQRATWGMLAGIFVWQAIEHSQFWLNLGIFTTHGLFFLVIAAGLVLVLWKRIFPVGLRFLLLLVLLNWFARLLVNTFAPAMTIDPTWRTGYTILRLITISGIATSLWFIILRSRAPIQRKYGAAALYFFVLLAILLS